MLGAVWLRWNGWLVVKEWRGLVGFIDIILIEFMSDLIRLSSGVTHHINDLFCIIQIRRIVWMLCYFWIKLSNRSLFGYDIFILAWTFLGLSFFLICILRWRILCDANATHVLFNVYLQINYNNYYILNCLFFEFGPIWPYKV